MDELCKCVHGHSLRQGLVMNPEFANSASLDSQLALGKSPVSSAYSLGRLFISGRLPHFPRFYMNVGDLNSSHCACVASVLSLETSSPGMTLTPESWGEHCDKALVEGTWRDSVCVQLAEL